MSDSARPYRWQPTRLPHPRDSLGKNTGVGCHFLLQCMKVKSESEIAQSCPTLSDPTDCSLPGSSVHGIFQARVLEWGAIAFSLESNNFLKKKKKKTWKKYSRLDFMNCSPLYLLLQVCQYKVSLDISWWGSESPAVFLRNATHILDKMFLYCVGLSHLLGHLTSLTLPVTTNEYSLPINLTAQNIPPCFPTSPRQVIVPFGETAWVFYYEVDD